MSLPWLKGAISGPIRAQAYCNSCTFFSRHGRRGERVGGEQGRGLAVLFVLECTGLSAADSSASD